MSIYPFDNFHTFFDPENIRNWRTTPELSILCVPIISTPVQRTATCRIPGPDCPFSVRLWYYPHWIAWLSASEFSVLCISIVPSPIQWTTFGTNGGSNVIIISSLLNPEFVSVRLFASEFTIFRVSRISPPIEITSVRFITETDFNVGRPNELVRRF